MVAPGPSSEEPIELIVSVQEAGQRLDRMLSARALGHSRSTLQRWIDEGRVEVDGEVISQSAKVRADSVVVLRPAPPPTSRALPEDIPLTILHEDEHLIVVDKPAGMVVHPAPGHASGTLVNALLFHRRLLGATHSERPGIVHRLDKDTSGVMVVAKSVSAREGLIVQFQAHSVERLYRAIVVGAPPNQVTYDTLFGRHPVHRKRFSSKVDKGKRAVTHLRVRARLRGTAEVECRLETGRTHQIRVHMADHGAPVLGDPMYGRPPRDPELRSVASTLARQALHAGVLGFRHPVTSQDLRFEAPPPPDYQRAFDALSS